MSNLPHHAPLIHITQWNPSLVSFYNIFQTQYSETPWVYSDNLICSWHSYTACFIYYSFPHGGQAQPRLPRISAPLVCEVTCLLNRVRCKSEMLNKSTKTKDICVCLTQWPWEIWVRFQLSNFQVNFNDSWLRDLMWNSLHVMVAGLHWWQVNVAYVISWCRQAASRYLSQCCPALCRHMTSLCHNELKFVAAKINLA